MTEDSAGLRQTERSLQAPPGTRAAAQAAATIFTSCHIIVGSNELLTVAGKRLVCSGHRLETTQMSINREQIHRWRNSRKTKTSIAIKVNKLSPHVTGQESSEWSSDLGNSQLPRDTDTSEKAAQRSNDARAIRARGWLPALVRRGALKKGGASGKWEEDASPDIMGAERGWLQSHSINCT